VRSRSAGCRPAPASIIRPSCSRCRCEAGPAATHIVDGQPSPLSDGESLSLAKISFLKSSPRAGQPARVTKSRTAFLERSGLRSAQTARAENLALVVAPDAVVGGDRDRAQVEAFVGQLKAFAMAQHPGRGSLRRLNAGPRLPSRSASRSRSRAFAGTLNTGPSRDASSFALGTMEPHQAA